MIVMADGINGISETIDETDMNILEVPEDLFIHLLPNLEMDEMIKANIYDKRNLEKLKEYKNVNTVTIQAN